MSETAANQYKTAQWIQTSLELPEGMDPANTLSYKGINFVVLCSLEQQILEIKAPHSVRRGYASAEYSLPRVGQGSSVLESTGFPIKMQFFEPHPK